MVDLAELLSSDEVVVSPDEVIWLEAAMLVSLDVVISPVIVNVLRLPVVVFIDDVPVAKLVTKLVVCEVDDIVVDEEVDTDGGARVLSAFGARDE